MKIKKQKKEKFKGMEIPDNFCPRCGSFEVEVTSDGITCCKNPSCLCVSKYDLEKNELTLKFKVNEK